MNYAELGRRVRQQRTLAQLTQEELAEAAGISLSFLGHIERGSRKASLETLVNLCNALRISPNILLQDSLNMGLLGDSRNISDGQRLFLREVTEQFFRYTDSFDNPKSKY